MSVIVVTACFTRSCVSALLTGYAALLAVMVATGIILTVTVVAEGWLDERITMVFSRITAIILAGLSVQYAIDGLTAIGIVVPYRLTMPPIRYYDVRGETSCSRTF